MARVAAVATAASPIDAPDPAAHPCRDPGRHGLDHRVDVGASAASGTDRTARGREDRDDPDRPRPRRAGDADPERPSTSTPGGLVSGAGRHGQLAGGPFSASPDGPAPTKPFLFPTKETGLHPVLAERFEARGSSGAYRVVVPAATHEAFSDGPLFRLRIVPTASTADDVTTVVRGFVAAFLDRVLRDEPVAVFGEVDAPSDVQVTIYPLDAR